MSWGLCLCVFVLLSGYSSLVSSQSTISSGFRHSCVIEKDYYAVQCWGDNSQSQIAPIPAGPFSQISVTYYTTCGIKRDDSTVRCWGGSLSGYSAPSNVAFSQISVGLTHVCGIGVSDSLVQCWGDGQQGASPTAVTFSKISSGWAYTCGIRLSDDMVECWGTSVSTVQPVPSAIAFSQISCGHTHCCGIRKADNVVQCWGAYSAPSGVSMSAISSQAYHTCGIRTSDMMVQCWGTDYAGETSTPSGITFSKISAGMRHNCGVKQSDNTIYCWGENTYGQCNSQNIQVALSVPPIGTVPNTPTNVTATNYQDRQTTVSWIAPFNGGYTIINYTIASNTGSIYTTTTNSNSYTITGLSNGNSYTFTVQANNILGTSAASTPSNTIIPGTVPTAPTNVIATNYQDRQTTVSWTTPSTNGGYTINNYTITSSAGSVYTTATATTSYAVTGLINGNSYTFTVQANNILGKSAVSATSNTIIPGTVPSTPTNVAATNYQDRQTTVSWAAPSNNGGYTINNYTITSGAGPVYTTTTAATSYTITGLINGNSYTFTVQANNILGTSAASTASNSIIPGTVPSTPTNVAATNYQDRQTIVSWTAPSNNGGYVINNYTITSSAGPVYTTATAVTSYIVTGLINGNSYTFTVQANNILGTSSTSTPSNTIIPGTAPSAPTNVIATNYQDRQTIVSWTTPSNNGGYVINNYTITSSAGSVYTTAANAASYSVTGLINGNSYTFTVQSSNVLGTSAASTTSNSIIPGTVPTAPTNVAATNYQDRQTTVAWTAPSNNGGYTINNYTITSSAGSVYTTTTATTSYTISGLINGNSYSFTVQANNMLGTSPLSTASNSIIPGTVPTAPTNVAAINYQDCQTIVSWTAPSSNGGYAIINYSITSSAGAVYTTATDATSYIVKGLINGNSYTFIVEANNILGTSAASGASNSIIPGTVPTAPTNVAAINYQDGQTTVSWSAPSSNGGYAINNYTITSSAGQVYTTTTNSTSYFITGLSNGNSYTFTVQANNIVGTSAANAPSNPIIPGTVPTAPTNVIATNYQDRQTTVSWTTPSTNGGYAINNYTIISSAGSVYTTATDATSFIVTGLINGNSYTFTVQANSILGTSAASTMSNIIIPGIVPATPTNVVAVNCQDRQTTVSWTTPSSNGGYTINNYTITSSTGSVYTTTTAVTSYIITGLINGNSYTFIVQANNILGTSAVAGSSNTIIPGIVPTAPTNVIAINYQDRQTTVSWTAPSSNGGYTINNYTITSSAGPIYTTTTSATSYTITGLINGNSYTFTVQANNILGPSAASSSSNTIIPGTAPASPNNVIATNYQDRQTTVSWTAPSSNGGYTINNYTITSSAGSVYTTTAVASSYTVTGLINGNSYTFTVQANNILGTSSVSATSNTIIPGTVPAAPTNVIATNYQDRQTTVSWTAASSNGGYAINNYTITSSAGSVYTTTTAATSFTITGLINGNSYTFTVQANNMLGTSASSTASNSIIPGTVPATSTNVAATNYQDRQTIVSWTAPSNNGGYTINNYTITSSAGPVYTTTTAGTSYIVTGLINGNSYSFTVEANNILGTSAASSSSNTIIPGSSSGASTNATSGNNATTTVSGIYQWSISIWGLCSSVCTQTRNVTCVSSDGFVVSDSFCAGPKVNTTQSCMPVVGSCGKSYQWISDSWSICSPACIQHRNVTCYSSSGLNISDTFCSDLKPNIIQSCSGGYCNNSYITYSWLAGVWSLCSDNCTQTRTLSCQSSFGSNVSDALCETSLKPLSFQSCSGALCSSSTVSSSNNNLGLSSSESSNTVSGTEMILGIAIGASAVLLGMFFGLYWYKRRHLTLKVSFSYEEPPIISRTPTINVSMAMISPVSLHDSASTKYLNSSPHSQISKWTQPSFNSSETTL